MRPSLALYAVALLASPATAQAQQAPRGGLVLQATPMPSPFLPLPSTPQAAVRSPGPVFEPAPTPDRDNSGPPPPRAGTDPQLSPTLFTRRNQYRGDGYSPGSTAQEEQERKVRPGAGFNVRMPFTPSK